MWGTHGISRHRCVNGRSNQRIDRDESKKSYIYIVLCHSIMQTRPARGKSRYVWLCFGCGTCSVSSNNIAPNEEGAFLLLAGSAVQICINASEFDHHRIARIYACVAYVCDEARLFIIALGTPRVGLSVCGLSWRLCLRDA